MEISNSLVAVLVVAAIVVSVAGTMTTMDILDQYVFSPGEGITGQVWGMVNVSVNQTVALVLTRQEVVFFLNPPSSGLEFMNDTEDNHPRPFALRNDGSTNLNVTLYANQTLFEQVSLPTEKFQYKCGDNSSTCDADGGSPASTTSFTNVPTSATLAIWNMSFQSGNNELEIEINATVPPNEPTGDKITWIEFVGVPACADAFCHL
ncbi:MAG: hypothetical protein DRO99_00580 [Candidatus Aenigmatarchaeota archaeon]|nr:MAG: hypothetical protein DRO99_00580 [Candidatus Aenigmarchaeota archaeon]